MNNELLSTLYEAIVSLNEQLKGTTDELNSFEDEYSKDKKQIHQQIDNITNLIYKLVKEEIGKIKIPTPKDGKDFDSVIAKALVTAEVNKLHKQKNKDVETIKDELLNYVIQEVQGIELPKVTNGNDGKKGADGKDGLDVTDAQIQLAVNKYINTNIDKLKGKDGQSIKGDKGIGIDDIAIKSDFLIITYDDGTTKKLKFPKQKVFMGGGGGSSVDISHLDKLQTRTELEGAYNSAYQSAFKDLTYIDGNITQIDIYQDDTKQLQLFCKVLTYTGSNITRVLTTNTIKNVSLQRDIVYSGGNISNINDFMI